MLALAPPIEPWFLSAAFLFVVFVVNLVVCGLIAWWMVRVVRALEASAKAQTWMAQQSQQAQARPQMAPAAGAPTPTQSLFG